MTAKINGSALIGVETHASNITKFFSRSFQSPLKV
jgi:hypothetical protein